MRPRKPTLDDCAFWTQQNGQPAEIKEMVGHHVGAADLEVVLNGDYVRVAWESDDRDSLQTIRGETVWTSFRGGMLPTDVVVVA